MSSYQENSVRWEPKMPGSFQSSRGTLEDISNTFDIEQGIFSLDSPSVDDLLRLNEAAAAALELPVEAESDTLIDHSWSEEIRSDHGLIPLLRPETTLPLLRDGGTPDTAAAIDGSDAEPDHTFPAADNKRKCDEKGENPEPYQRSASTSHWRLQAPGVTSEVPRADSDAIETVDVNLEEGESESELERTLFTGKRKRDMDEEHRSNASDQLSDEDTQESGSSTSIQRRAPKAPRIHINAPSPSTSPAKGFFCKWDDCNKWFDREADRDRHLKIHDSNAAANLLECQVCGKNIQSGRADSLRRHQLYAKACLKKQNEYTKAELREKNCATRDKRTASKTKAKQKA